MLELAGSLQGAGRVVNTKAGRVIKGQWALANQGTGFSDTVFGGDL